MPVRVLIVTASIGEGHDLPARTLAAQLRTERPDAEVLIEDGLSAMGRLFTAVNVGGPRIIYYRARWVFDLVFWLFASVSPTRRLGRFLLGELGAPGLRQLIRSARPDIVVSTYPATSDVLGQMRRRGELDVPACAAITDLSALHYWAAPGIDLHLVTHPESIPEVRRIAGADADVRCVHGLTAPEFAEPRDRGEARRELGLSTEGKIVLVSGGGWGVGDLEGAVDVALANEAVATVVCLCGRNAELRTKMEARYGGNVRVRVVGFTDRMGDWLAAGDALIHSTAGLTILEAHIRGCPAISYGWSRGHIRANEAAFRRLGLADVATSRAELATALRRALAERKPQDSSFAALTSAASLVLALAAGGLPA
jgi:processive 1,2-diacylglycerol beta-glucosyltransferase